MRLPLLLALMLGAVLALAGGARAQDFKGPLQTPKLVNLDADPEPETLSERELRCFTEDGETPPPCGEDASREITATLGDTCSGTTSAIDVLEPVDVVTTARVGDLDGDPSRPEVLVVGVRGATGRSGDIAVVRLTDVPGGCPQVKTLFSHPGPDARTRKPRGAVYASVGYVRVRDYRKRYRGRELRLDQSWYRRLDAGCCPSYRSTAWFRYSAGPDAYVRYRTKVRRLPQRG